MKALPIKYQILLALTVILTATTIATRSLEACFALCIIIAALQVESYLDAITYKKSEEVRQDIETLAKAIDDISTRTAKIELRNAFNPEE